MVIQAINSRKEFVPDRQNDLVTQHCSSEVRGIKPVLECENALDSWKSTTENPKIPTIHLESQHPL